MCYITDSANRHELQLHNQPVEMEKCVLCEDEVHETMCIKHPMTNDPVCKWCCDNHSLLRNIIENADPEDMEDYVDDVFRAYKKKFNP